MTIKPGIGFFILILIVAIPLFAHLDSLPLAEWDESRLASSALEMNYNHNWIVTTYNNNPDMWSTKPPLMIWLQVITMKVIGINELAVRLPSALAALGTCLLLFYFFTKKYKEPWLGLIAVAVLVTADGYIHSHTARSGEYDSLLTMLMTGYALFYFLYLEEGGKKYIYVTFIMLILAALDKGIQSLLFLPVLFIYTIYKKKVIAILKQKELYIGIAAFIFFVIGYYLLREHYNPGYIAAVWQNELGGRYNTVIESHNGDTFTYYNWIIDTQFHYWYLLILPGVICGMCSRQKWLKDLTIYITLLALIYFLVLSNAQTKLWWYTMPLYPFLSVLVAIFSYTIFTVLADMEILKQKFRYNPLPFVFIFFIFIMPYTAMVNLVFARPAGDGSSDEIKNMELFLKDVLHNKRNINGYSILDPGPEQHLGWYYKIFAYQHRPIGFIHVKDLVPNSMVLAYQPEAKKYIEDHYSTQIIQTYYNVTEYKLNDRK